jgi:tRNA(Met) C34 N-acetyltransferase TmcA
MLKPLNNENNKLNIEPYVNDFKRRFMTLLSFEFRKLNASLAL